MKSDELSGLTRAIDKTTEFFKRRTHANDWARNIEEGSAGLRTKQQWGRYYKWMSNPENFNLHEEVEYMDVDEYNPEPYEDCMCVEETVNGPDLLIRVTRKPTQDEEKLQE